MVEPCDTPHPDATASGDPVMLEILKSLATPEEVDFLAAVAFGDLDPDSIPRGRESMAFLAGMAARARNAGTPFEATWSLIVERRGLDRLRDPAAVALWSRIRAAMRTLAESGLPGEPKKSASLALKEKEIVSEPG